MTDQPISLEDQKKAVEHLDRILARWIKWVAAILVTGFSFLEFRNAPLGDIANVFQDTALTKLGLFILFIAWAFGATDDTKIQTTAYGYDPHGGRLGLAEFAGIAVFLIIFGGLFALHTYPVYFQLFLLVFVCTNMWTYSVIVMGRCRSIIENSAKLYAEEGDYARYMKLYCAVEYLLGGWQRRRFIILFVLALLQLGVSTALTYTPVLAYLPDGEINGITMAKLSVYLPSALFVFYVIVSEVWIKIYLFKVFADFETIEETHEHFRVQRKPKTDLPPIDASNLFKRKLSPHPSYR